MALSPLLLARYGWRAIFYVFGALGLPLLAFWGATARREPPQQGLATSRQPSEDGSATVIRSGPLGGSRCLCEPAWLAGPLAGLLPVLLSQRHVGPWTPCTLGAQ